MASSRIGQALRATVAVLVAAFGGASCSSPGPYGHAQLYSPLDAEEQAAENSVPFDPSASRRRPDAWRGRLVATFGVVSEAEARPQGRKLLLSVRGLQSRNLCDGPDEETCRVTVSQTEFAKVWVVFSDSQVVPKTNPPDPFQPGSLLRVIGKLEPAPNDVDFPTISATMVRHWPVQTYVTTGARDSMRR